MMKLFSNHPLAIKLKMRWNTLSASEQKTLSWGAWILVPMLAYAVLWQPAHSTVDKLHISLPLLRAQLVQMRAQSDEVQTLRQQVLPAVSDGASLKKIVESAAAQEGWAAPAVLLELTEQNDVRIIAESIPFARWLHFLRELDATHHIRVGTLSVSPSSAAGVVKISGTLTSGAEQ
jgi:type II secretory pathway component PulM